MSKHIVTVALFIFCNNAFSCFLPAQGTSWTHDELIEKTNTIYLATPISENHQFKFKVLEVLKGQKVAELQWRVFRRKSKHLSTDFNSHEHPDFWKEEGEKYARSPRSSGACTLQFTFVSGENYLIFKESSGHFHSAEIIKSPSDKWYKYVRTKINHNKARQNSPAN